MDKRILAHQRNEITEFYIYHQLAKLSQNPHNKVVLKQIGDEEKKHYAFWQNITKQEIKTNRLKIKWFVFLAKVFGLAFALRLLEKGERSISKLYQKLEETYPGIKEIKEDEDKHESKLIAILNDTRLNYAGAIVLGLNDALVEFTGTIAGLTFAFANNQLIAMTGLIMGIAASLSMAASGYLASKEEEYNEDVDPVTSAIYTGMAYIITVALLVFPYFIFEDPYHALWLMLIITILIIASYTYYISIAKALSFWKRFLEMAAISIGVAIISFGIGILVKNYFGIDI